MRILIDTNVLFSAIVFPKSIPSQTFDEIILNHVPIICEYTLLEMNTILTNKAPRYLLFWDKLINSLRFDLAYTPGDTTKYQLPYIRDEKDIPILVSALTSEADSIISGDKDLHTPEIKEIFTVYTPSGFLSLSKEYSYF